MPKNRVPNKAILAGCLSFPGAGRRHAFEGARTWDGELFKLTEHTDRLFKSAEILDFEIPRTVEQIDGACKATKAENGLGAGGGLGVSRCRV